MKRYFLLLTPDQITLLFGVLSEFYLDDEEVRRLMRTISSQVDNSLNAGGTID